MIGSALMQNRVAPPSSWGAGGTQGSTPGGGFNPGAGFDDLEALELASQGVKRSAFGRSAGLSRLRVAYQNSHVSFFQRRAQVARRHREAFALRQRQARRKKVQLYRRYRTGELPDLNIPLKDIAKPLQALCERDPVVARLVFAEIYRVIYSSPQTSPEVCRSIKATLGRILTHTQHHPGFVSCLQLVLLASHRADHEARVSEHKNGTSGGGGDPTAGAFAVEPRLIGEASVRSMNFAGGVELLEAGLSAAGKDAGRHSKRAAGKGKRARRQKAVLDPNSVKGATYTRDVPPATASRQQLHDAWTQLTRLYVVPRVHVRVTSRSPMPPTRCLIHARPCPHGVAAPIHAGTATSGTWKWWRASWLETRLCLTPARRWQLRSAATTRRPC